MIMKMKFSFKDPNGPLRVLLAKICEEHMSKHCALCTGTMLGGAARGEGGVWVW
jgi:hypothetical protein